MVVKKRQQQDGKDINYKKKWVQDTIIRTNCPVKSIKKQNNKEKIKQKVRTGPPKGSAATGMFLLCVETSLHT